MSGRKGPGRPRKDGTDASTLKDLGLTKRQAREARRLAEIPESEWERWKAQQDSRTLTSPNALHAFAEKGDREVPITAETEIRRLLRRFPASELQNALDCWGQQA